MISFSRRVSITSLRPAESEGKGFSDQNNIDVYKSTVIELTVEKQERAGFCIYTK